MAALREGASANEDLSSRCLSLLDEVKDLIEAHKSGQSGENSASDREARPSSLPEASTTVNRWQGVMQNFRSLFAPYSASASSSSRPLPAKKSRTFYQVKETWTHDFFCLASSSADNVPRRAEKLAL